MRILIINAYSNSPQGAALFTVFQGVIMRCFAE
jgi:hypothetical protein